MSSIPNLRPLSRGIIGKKRSIYAALADMAEDDGTGTPVAYFRRHDLAQAAGVSTSSSYLSVVLAWLERERYILEYTPGNPGTLSRAALATTSDVQE